jgi:exopolysaccharide biosynthesis polyprenyl glycosylphosphotransferase
MKNNASLIYSIFLVIGDFITLLVAFSFAYILRVKYDPRPLIEQIPAETYFYGLAAVLPLWVLVHAFIGLYNRDVYENRFREFGRLIVGSILGILFIIGYDFVIDDRLFPARLVAVYGLLLSLAFLILFRAFARELRAALFSYGIGVNNVLIVGNGPVTAGIIEELEDTHRSGHRILGIVGEPHKGFRAFETFDEAIFKLKNKNLHSIIQTELDQDGLKNDTIMGYAQVHHIAYRFIPASNSELFVGNIEVELFRGTPVITVHQTALVGWGRALKRTFDVIVGTLFLLISLPLMLMVAIAQKLQEPSGSILFRQVRLTQFDREFKVYKFRTMKTKYSGLSPEEAFRVMGKPELAKKYRDGGDALINDPRISRFGRFLRATSLDELPQLFNVVKGDISLVGPRALVPEELKAYRHKHNILSVKSGLTGLAQVSGRREISFAERRKLDTYYVQNWSFWLDIIILLKTFRAVLARVGAK